MEDNFPNLKPLCGTRVYEVVDGNDDAVTWMPVTGSAEPYTITASPTEESLIGSTLNYFLKITFADANYPIPVRRDTLDVTVVSATCNCELLEWDNPTVVTDTVDVALGPTTITMPTIIINEASKLPTPAIRKCYESGDTCEYTSTWAPIDATTGVIPDFMT